MRVCGVQIEVLQQYPVSSYPALPYPNQRKPDMHRIQTRSKRKTALQKRLEGNVRRTIYICDIDQQVSCCLAHLGLRNALQAAHHHPACDAAPPEAGLLTLLPPPDHSFCTQPCMMWLHACSLRSQRRS